MLILFCLLSPGFAVMELHALQEQPRDITLKYCWVDTLTFTVNLFMFQDTSRNQIFIVSAKEINDSSGFDDARYSALIEGEYYRLRLEKANVEFKPTISIRNYSWSITMGEKNLWSSDTADSQNDILRNATIYRALNIKGIMIKNIE